MSGSVPPRPRDMRLTGYRLFPTRVGMSSYGCTGRCSRGLTRLGSRESLNWFSDTSTTTQVVSNSGEPLARFGFFDVTIGVYDNRALHSSNGLNHSLRSSEAMLLGIKFSDFYVSKQDSVNPWREQLRRYD